MSLYTPQDPPFHGTFTVSFELMLLLASMETRLYLHYSHHLGTGRVTLTRPCPIAHLYGATPAGRITGKHSHSVCACSTSIRTMWSHLKLCCDIHGHGFIAPLDTCDVSESDQMPLHSDTWCQRCVTLRNKRLRDLREKPWCCFCCHQPSDVLPFLAQVLLSACLGCFCGTEFYREVVVYPGVPSHGMGIRPCSATVLRLSCSAQSSRETLMML